MGDSLRKMDVEELISYSDDLIRVLKDKRDINNFTLCLQHLKSLSSSCDAHLSETQSFIKDYQKKIDICKQKTEEAKSKAATDEELEHLQKELEEDIIKERVLEEELRGIANEICYLECQRISIREHKQTLKKLEQDELRAQRLLSLYASVTNVIPNLDVQSNTSGYTVDRDKKVVEKFELDISKMTALDACNSIWKKINS